ncbi:MAG: hypothetical protein LLG24_00270 [Actinomycetia bacterium]|nr:hypothetical protein [Actinomycetes bacterium]
MADDDDVTATPGRGRAARSVLVLLVALAVGAAAYAAVRALDRPRAARARLSQASAMLSEAEPDVLAIDNAVRSEVTSALADSAKAALGKIDPATQALTRALEEVEATRPDLSKDDVELADALEDAIRQRLAMLDHARPILETDRRAARAVGPAAEAWRLVSEAETLSDSAVASYNKHTKASVSQSTSLTAQAEAKLASAKSALATVTAEFPEADMAPFVSYVDAKLKLLARSKKIDATWLAGKIEDANKLLDAYNAEEKKVVAMAKALPGSPTEVLSKAYEKLTAADIAAYFDAREAARSADARIKALSESEPKK